MGILGIPDRWKRPLAIATSAATAAALSVVVISTPSQAAGQPAINLDQCRNGAASDPKACEDLGGSAGWVNGNVGASQAHMVEGFSTPFRAVMTNLPTDSEVTLVLGYDIKNSGKNAYDFLTGVDNLDPHTAFGHNAENVDPTDGVSGYDTATTDFEQLPAPANAPAAVLASRTALINAGKGDMALYGGNFSASIALSTPGNLALAQSEARITVKFKATSETAVLAWGGHIAKCEDWPKDTDGTCSSAAGISGSPYHMRLISWNLNNLGNTDRSMAAAVVTAPGSLVLAKVLTGNYPTGYTGPFTINYNCGTGYTGSVSVSAGSSQTVSGLPAGASCTVSETLPTPPAGYSFGTPTISPNPVTITAGASVTVTTTNTMRKTSPLTEFTISKTVTGAPAGFDATYTVAWSCTSNGSPAGSGTVDIKAGATSAAIPVDLYDSNGNLRSVTCTISEPTLPTAPTGYSWGTPVINPDSHTFSSAAPGSFAFTVGNSLTRDTGSLQISKTLSNTEGASVQASFTVNYSCTDGTSGSVSVGAGASQTVSGIPTGSVCSVSEVTPTPVAGYTWDDPTYTPTTVTISTKGGTFEIVVANKITRDKGSLTITKAFDAKTSGFTGKFTINYTCTSGVSGSVELGAGDSSTVSGIPTGTECTVSEPTLPTAPTGWTFGTPVLSDSQAPTGDGKVVITDKGATYTVTVTNSITRDLGKLTVTKAFDPLTSGWSDPFSVAFVCTLGGSTVDSGNLSVPAGGSASVNNLPTGTSCTVSETTPAPPTGWTFGAPVLVDDQAPINDGTVVIVEKGGEYVVAVTNSITRDTGSLTITKAFDAKTSGFTGKFTINYTCTDGTTGSKSLGAGESATVSGIPTGTDCTVSEPVLPTPPTGWTFGTPVLSDSQQPTDDGKVTITTKGASYEVTVTNSISRDTGSLKVVKTLSNPDGAAVQSTFTVNYDCGNGLTGSLMVMPGTPATQGGIPTGSTCSVTEVTPTAVPGFTWADPTYTPSSVVIDTKGGEFTITVANSITRDRGSLKISKTLSNPDGATVPASFTVNYDCGTGYTGSATIGVGSPATINGIPTGSTCSVTEVAPAAIPGYTWGTVTYSPASITIDTKAGTFEITVGNSITRDLGSLKISKSLSNPDGATVPTSFSISYDCGTGYTGSVSVAAGAFATVSGIPTGSTCTVSEAALDPIAGYTWATPTYTPASVVIDTKGGTFEIAVANSITRDKGTLIVKKVTKPSGGGPFQFTTTGEGYTAGYQLSDGGQNSAELKTGQFTVTEVFDPNWVFTGVTCVSSTGSFSGSTDQTTSLATINLRKGETVTCTYENSGPGTTRTQGFWATHLELAQSAWFGSDDYGIVGGHDFGTGVEGSVLGDEICATKAITTPGQLMGGFWSSVASKSDGKKRSALDKSRMILLQQLLAAELNYAAFGTTPAGGTATLEGWEDAFCGTNQTAIKAAAGQAAAFNEAGDSGFFTPGISANAVGAKSVADRAFWDNPTGA